MSNLITSLVKIQLNEVKNSIEAEKAALNRREEMIIESRIILAKLNNQKQELETYLLNNSQEKINE